MFAGLWPVTNVTDGQRFMQRTLIDAIAATALIGLSFYAWRTAYQFGDWAIVTLIPLAVSLYIGFWSLALAPWRARLRIALRDQSPLSRILTGRIRATLLAAAFTSVAIILLAWQTLVSSAWQGMMMLVLVLAAGSIFAGGERCLSRHFHQPFARAIAVSFATWVVALPFYLIIAFQTWAFQSHPGAIVDASLLEAVQIGIDRMPRRHGWVANVLAVPYAYESAKLWLVIQLRDYPVIGVLFSLDAAVFSFILARVSVVITQFVRFHVRGELV